MACVSDVPPHSAAEVRRSCSEGASRQGRWRSSAGRLFGRLPSELASSARSPGTRLPGKPPALSRQSKPLALSTTVTGRTLVQPASRLYMHEGGRPSDGLHHGGQPCDDSCQHAHLVCLGDPYLPNTLLHYLGRNVAWTRHLPRRYPLEGGSPGNLEGYQGLLLREGRSRNQLTLIGTVELRSGPGE